MKRKLDFLALQSIQLVSYFLSYALLGVPLAYAGFGVWSLVAAQLSMTTLLSLSFYWRTRHPVKPRLRPQNPAILEFGSKVIAVNMVNRLWIFESLVVLIALLLISVRTVAGVSAFRLSKCKSHQDQLDRVATRPIR